MLCSCHCCCCCCLFNTLDVSSIINQMFIHPFFFCLSLLSILPALPFLISPFLFFLFQTFNSFNSSNQLLSIISFSSPFSLFASFPPLPTYPFFPISFHSTSSLPSSFSLPHLTTTHFILTLNPFCSIYPSYQPHTYFTHYSPPPPRPELYQTVYYEIWIYATNFRNPQTSAKAAPPQRRPRVNKVTQRTLTKLCRGER